MALKENIEAIKREIGVEEQFLEGMIKSEHFYKRYKVYILISAVVALFAIGTYVTMGILKENRLEISNDAYNRLLKDPNDMESKAVLKENNERLYYFLKFQKATRSDDITLLGELANYKKDPVISDLASYQLYSIQRKESIKSELLPGFIVLKEGYKLLKEGRTEEARLKFAQIDLNSPLKNISDNLEHYHGAELK